MKVFYFFMIILIIPHINVFLLIIVFHDQNALSYLLFLLPHINVFSLIIVFRDQNIFSAYYIFRSNEFIFTSNSCSNLNDPLTLHIY